MEIHKHNYEAFLLDLLEGRLSAAEEQKLRTFLDEHPELVAEMPDVELLSLEQPLIRYPESERLKKELPSVESILTEANFDMFSVARMEGDLTPVQEQEHKDMVLRDDEKRKEWHTWEKTRLAPMHIPYPGKNSLKRKKAARSRMIWMGGLAAAASLALILILLRLDPAMPELAVSETEAALSGQSADAPQDTPFPAQLPDAIEDPSSTAEATSPGIVNSREEHVAPSGAEPRESPVLAQNHLEEIIPEVLPAQSDDGQLTGQPLEIPYRPLGIAERLEHHPEMFATAAMDQIQSLSLPTVSPKLVSLSVGQLASMDRRELFEEFTQEHNISLLSVANAGIKGINRLTGSDISLMASRDDQGDVSGFSLRSRRFSWTSPVGRDE